MAELVLKVKAEYDEAIRCREEMKRVEEQMKRLDASATPQEIARLTREYATLSAQWENHMSLVGKAGVFVKEAYQQIGKAVKSGVEDIIEIGNSSKDTISMLEKRLVLEEKVRNVLEKQREAAEKQRNTNAEGYNRNKSKLDAMESNMQAKYGGKAEGFYDEADLALLERGREAVANWAKAWEDSNVKVQVYEQLIEDCDARTQKLNGTMEQVKNVYKGFADTAESASTKIFISEDVFRRYDELSNTITRLKQEITDVGSGDDIDIPKLQDLQNQLSAAQEEFRVLDNAARGAAEVLGTDLADKVSVALSKLFNLNDEVRKSQASYDGLEKELKEANEELRKQQEAGDPKGIMKARAEVDRLTVSVDEASDRLSKFRMEQKDAINEIQNISKSLDNVGGGGGDDVTNAVTDQVKGLVGKIAAIAGIGFGLNELKDFFGQAKQWREYFQDIESSMKVFLGSAEKGAEFTAKLKDYAYYNMFEFSELAQASQQMISYGHNVESIIPRLDQLSNVATGTHGSLMELVETYNRAKATGVVDARGIQSWAVKGVMIRDVLRDMGETVSGTTVTFDQLNKVLDKITGEGGQFHGLMLEMMDNISAESGQLEDNLAAMYSEIGEKFEGVFIKWLKLQSAMADSHDSIVSDGLLDWGAETANAVLDDLLENWQKYIGVVKDAVVIYGSYRAALIVTTAVQKAQAAWDAAAAAAKKLNSMQVTKETLAKAAETAAEQANTAAKRANAAASGTQTAATGANIAATNADTIAKGRNTAATVLMAKASKALSASFLTNPYVLAAAAIAGIAYACYAAYDSMMTEEKAQRLLNAATEDYNEKVKEQEEKDRENIRVIQDKTASLVAQTKAYKDLIKERAIFAGFTKEEIANMSSEQISSLLNQDNEQKNEERLRNQVEAAKELQSLFNGKGAAWSFAEDSDIDAVVAKFKLLPEYAEKLKDSIGGTTNLNDWSDELVKATSGELQKYLVEQAESGITEGFRKGFSNPELRASSSKLIKDYADAIEKQTGDIDEGFADAFKNELKPQVDDAQKRVAELNHELANATGEKKTEIETKLKTANDDLNVLQSMMAFFEAGDKELSVKISGEVEDAILGDEKLIEIGNAYKEIDDKAVKYTNSVIAAREEMQKLGNVSVEQAREIAEKHGLTAESIKEDFGAAYDKVSKDINDLENELEKTTNPSRKREISLEIARKKEQLEYIDNIKKQLSNIVANPYQLTLNFVGKAQKWLMQLLKLAGFDVPDDVNGTTKEQRERSQRAQHSGNAASERNKKETETPRQSSKKYIAEETAQERQKAADYRKYKSGVGKINVGGTEYDLANLTAEENDKLKTYFKGADALLKKGQQQTKEALQRRQKDYEQFLKEREKSEEQAQKASNAVEDARIAAIRDEGERERAEHEQQYKKTLQQIADQEEAMKKANVEQQRAEWSNKKENKDKIWADTALAQDIKANGYDNVALTADQEKEIKALRDKAREEERRYLEARTKEEMASMVSYLKQYGTFEQQKLAITKEYEEKIAKARTQGEKYQLTAQRDNELNKVEEKRMEADFNFEDAFNNLEYLSKQKLQDLKTKLQEKAVAGTTSLEEYKVAAEQIDKINEAIIAAEQQENMFLGMTIQRGTERKKLEMDVAAAFRQQLLAAQAVTDATLKQEKAQEKVRNLMGGKSYKGNISVANSKNVLEDAKTKYGENSEQYKAVKKAMEELEKTTRDLNEAEKKKEQADLGASGAVGKLNKYLSDFRNGLKDLMPTFEQIASNLSSLPSLMDTLGLGDSDAGKAVSSFADAANSGMNAMKDFMSGNYVGAAMNALNAVGSAVSGAITLFAGSGNVEESEDHIKELTASQDLLRQSIDSLTEVMTDSTTSVADSFEQYERIVNAENKAIALQQEKIDTRAHEYSNGGHGFLGTSGESSYDYYLQNRLNRYYEGGWPFEDNSFLDDIMNTLKEFGQDVVLRNSSDFWNLTPEQWKIIRDYAPDAYEKLFSLDGEANPRELVDEMIEHAGRLEDFLDQLGEKITGYTFEGFLDSYKSMLKNAESTTEDFANNITNIISDAVAEAFMNSTEMKARIKKLYEKIRDSFREGSEGGTSLTDAELKEIMADSEEITQDMIAWRETMKQLGLFQESESGTEQSASVQAMQRISTDQADELIGRMNVGQLIWQREADQVTLLNAKVSDIYGVEMEHRDIASDSRDILASMAIHVEQIRDGVVDNLVPKIRSIDDTLGDIKRIVEGQ